MDTITFFLALFAVASFFFILYAIEKYNNFRHTSDLFKRAYFFLKKDYSIGNNNTITLYPTKTSDPSMTRVALQASLMELCDTFPNLARMMDSTVRIISHGPVWFNMDTCLSFPFATINAAEVELDSCLCGLLCTCVNSNPIIEKIIFPKNLQQLNISVELCPKLKSIQLPRSDRAVELCFPEERFPIWNVHPDFTIQVPSSLLEVYENRYSNISVRYADNQTSQLRFSPI